MLHVSTALTHDLGTQVEARNWFEVNGNALVWPFAL
jgi:hypothetical protein